MVDDYKVVNFMLYHVTPSENVKNILKNGLIPSVGAASQQVGEECPRVYLFTSLKWVKEGVETWLSEVYWDKDLTVLSIDSTAKKLGGERYGGEVLVEKPIPPNLIKVLYPADKVYKGLGIAL